MTKKTTNNEVADVGNNRSTNDAVWISVEGPGVGTLVEILQRDYDIRTTQLVEVEPWFFRARVVNYNPESVELEGFSINDGTYVSEVDHGYVQRRSEGEVPEGETTDEGEAEGEDDDSV